ncbi:D-amino acid dehydrogenase small subunit [Achromobacter sp. 2789STDY5608633]|jgi:glycine/D-amino acid oxidase-like deaminating enzyme|uniref:D-amino acid dehydrogenase n=2 Tax=Achromobacter insuavis TaxID=1287735 RepID=A0A6J5B2B3_9BURK|nr:FAD-dependent oxidoreductase [Achromobacter insuavis]CAB3689192.1 D-amino acid dehydrogenase [Achromobacter insuavis]CUI94824.1 D-amino acid dehydrogenase small subunit [Achromobacter sp. 2789STDY5608633]CUJ21900.1 D-amino acid dehydrogenase small subunit [Achromobacter sp. 2789STDY5608628]
MPAVRKVVVLGAGVLGLSVAAELAERGARVVVAAPPLDHRTASLRSYSWLNAFGAAPESYRRLRLLSLDRYRTLAGPGAPWLRFDGSLTWRDADKRELLQARAEALSQSGYGNTWVDADAAARLEPALDRAALDGHALVHTPGEGWVDLPEYLHVLRRRIAARDGQFVTLTQPPLLRVAGGKITGVQVDGRTSLDADSAVLAAGAGTPALLRQVGIELPVQTNTALLVTARASVAVPKAVLRAPDIAIRPRADGLLALHADWADTRVAGDDERGWSVTPDVIDAVTAAAARWLAGRPAFTEVQAGIGLRPIPGDQRAVAGEVADIGGLSVAFSHSAATLAPILSELLAAEIIDGTPSPLLADFRPARFAA